MGEGTSGGHAQAELPQVAFEDLQGKKLHSLSKPPLPVLHHLHSKKKKKKTASWNSDGMPSIPVCAHYLMSCSEAPKSLDLSSWHSPFRHLQTLIRSPWHFSFLGCTDSIPPGFLHGRDALEPSSSLNELYCCYMPLSYRRAQNWTQHFMWELTKVKKGRITSLNLLPMFLLTQTRMLLAFLAAKAQY